MENFIYPCSSLMILVYIINGKTVNFDAYLFEMRFVPSCNVNLVPLSSQRRQKG